MASRVSATFPVPPSARSIAFDDGSHGGNTWCRALRHTTALAGARRGPGSGHHLRYGSSRPLPNVQGGIVGVDVFLCFRAS
jgi:hypothetical protein